MNLNDYIGVTPDFPKKGISFKDVSPLLKDPKAFSYCISELEKLANEYKPTIIVGAESRGFIFGSALALKMGIGFVMARKEGKLPGKTYKVSYELEYGNATMEVPANSFKRDDRVLLVDDLLATGGTFAALTKLVKEAGGNPVGAITVIRLYELEGEKNAMVPCSYLLNLSDSHWFSWPMY